MTTTTDKLAEALQRVLDAHEKEAKAYLTAQVASDNFSRRSAKADEHAHLAAMMESSKAEKAAREALAEHRAAEKAEAVAFTDPHYLRVPQAGGSFGARYKADEIFRVPLYAGQPPASPVPDSSSVSSLRWLLNLTTEFDRKDVRTRQAARLLDEYTDSGGRTNRQSLEGLWKWCESLIAAERKRTGEVFPEQRPSAEELEQWK